MTLMMPLSLATRIEAIGRRAIKSLAMEGAGIEAARSHRGTSSITGAHALTRIGTRVAPGIVLTTRILTLCAGILTLCELPALERRHAGAEVWPVVLGVLISRTVLAAQIGRQRAIGRWIAGIGITRQRRKVLGALIAGTVLPAQTWWQRTVRRRIARSGIGRQRRILSQLGQRAIAVSIEAVELPLYRAL